MKFKKVVVTLLAVILMGTNSLVYANDTNQQYTQGESTQEGLAEIYHKAGLDSPEVIINTLENLGISEEELKEYVGQGKKICDILQQKQITMAKFKKALNKEYLCTIKKATKNKTITKQEAKILTDLLKERMSEWDI